MEDSWIRVKSRTWTKQLVSSFLSTRVVRRKKKPLQWMQWLWKSLVRMRDLASKRMSLDSTNIRKQKPLKSIWKMSPCLLPWVDLTMTIIRLWCKVHPSSHPMTWVCAPHSSVITLMTLTVASIKFSFSQKLWLSYKDVFNKNLKLGLKRAKLTRN